MIKSLLLIIIYANIVCAQTVIQTVFSDYKGFLESDINNNTLIPVNDRHHVIGFQWRDSYFSTGVADDLLLVNKPDLLISKQPFMAFPTDSLAPAYNKDRFANLIGVPKDYVGYLKSDYKIFLNDGIRGLDVSTAVFNMNLNKPDMVFRNITVTESTIGDNIPDILLTQTGQPANNADKFYFQDKNGDVVGFEYLVQFKDVPIVLKSNFRFYQLNYSNIDRNLIRRADVDDVKELRMLAFDWSDLGITKDNYKDIYSFVQKFSGESDIAFIAYNQNSLRFLRNIRGKVEIDNGSRIPFQEIKLDLYLVNEDGEVETNSIDSTRTDGKGNYSFNNVISNVKDTKYKIVLDYSEYNPRFFIVDNRDSNLNDYLETSINLKDSDGNDFILGNFCVLEPTKATGGETTITGISTISTQLNGWPTNIKNGFLALDSKEKGFVITRTTSEKIPADFLIEGMMIYDTTDNCIKLYNGAEWSCISRDCNERIFNPDKPSLP